MNRPSDTFVDAAIGAVNALRLFAHNSRLPEAAFTSTLEGHGPTQRELIQFRSTQCWGDIARTQEGLTLCVSPIVGVADSFVARRLQFPRASYAASRLMTATPDEMLDNDGRDFVLEFCGLIDIHQATFGLLPYRLGDKDHLIMVRPPSAPDAELVKNVDDMARSINPALEAHGLRVYTAHPAFDIPGGIHLIDSDDRIHAMPFGPLAERLKQLSEGAKRLPPALRFDLVNGEFPSTYAILPHAFTLAEAKDKRAAIVHGILASANMSIQDKSADVLAEYRVTVICRKPEADPLSRAVEIMLEDWASSPVGFIKPEILDKAIEFETPDHYEVTLRLLADKDAAESYNEVGCFDVLPV